MAGKSAGGCNCCCADCSPNLPHDFHKCCFCICDELCVTLSQPGVTRETTCPSDCLETTGTGNNCYCVESKGNLLWDANLCAWNGTVTCGTIAVPFKVEPHRDGSTCYLKITSACLGLNEALYSFTDCGDYKRRCKDLSGGPSVTFNVDASGCGDSACTNIDVTIGCQSYINPGTLTCKDCDCICKCLCITYEEDGCEVTKRACWDGTKWEVTFDDSCSWDAQTVTITFAGDSNRCCQLNLAVTRGTVDTPSQNVDCPRPTNTWTGSYASGTGTSSFQVDIACDNCETCKINTPCCNNIPATIYAVVCEDNCPNSDCIALSLVSNSAEEIEWRGSGVAQCSDGGVGSSSCEDFNIDIAWACVFDSGMSTWDTFVRIYCGSTLINEVQTAASCEPLCDKATFAVEDFVNACNPSISCVGTNVTIDIVEDCR